MSLALMALAVAGWTQSKPVAITNARIVTEPGKVIEGGSVLIKDGKIAEVGKSVKTEGADILDGKGLVVYAGFIDAYATTGLKVPDAPANATPRNATDKAWATMWHENRSGNRANLIAADLLDLESRLKSSYENGITSSLLCSGVGMFRGSASVVKMQKEPSVLAKQYGQDLAIRGGGGFGGGGGGGYPGSLMGTTALFRQVLYDAQSYNGTPKDDYLAALKEVVDGKQMAVFGADTNREIYRALTFSKEFGLKTVIQGGREAYQLIDELKEAKTPVIARVDIGNPPSMTPSGPEDQMPQEARDERLSLYKERAANIPALMKAGIPVSLTSGISGPGSFLEGVRRVIESGLSEDDALRGLTINPARLFGLEDRIGRIANGKDADIVVMTGDLKSKDAKVKWIFVNGNKVEVNP